MPEVTKPKRARKKCEKDRAIAAGEVLAAVWLREQDLELDYEVHPSDATEDKDGNPWITVRIQVPQLDVDLWLDGTHRDHPNNADEDE